MPLYDGSAFLANKVNDKSSFLANKVNMKINIKSNLIHQYTFYLHFTILLFHQ